MTAEIHPYLIVSSVIFSVGVFGLLLNRRHIIHLLLCVELILLAVNINFVAFSWEFNDLSGQIFCLFVLGIAATEAAIGLAILVIYFRQHNSISLDPYLSPSVD